MTQKIFDADEMKLHSVDPSWSTQEMLEQDGIFFLKDVAAKLKISTMEFKNRAKKLQDQGENPWEVMGIRKTWTHWQVRMKVFRTFYQEWMSAPRLEEVRPEWDANDLIGRPGIYSLNEVCKKIPFSPRQIRYQMQKFDDPKAVMGIWKDPTTRTFFVDMKVFGPFLRDIWKDTTTL